MLFVAAAVVVSAVGAVVDPMLALPVVGCLVIGAVAARRPFVPWIGAVALLLAVIIFVPARRYVIGLNLPFQAEPYRLLLAAMFGAWALSLLADRRVVLRRSFLDVAVLAVLFVSVASVAANDDRAQLLQGNVTKALLALTSLVLLFFLLTSVLASRADVDRLVKVLVGGGALVAAAAVVEARTHTNVFDHLGRVGPFLQYAEAPPDDGGFFRARASAQHPIALGAALVMLVPLAVYLARTQRSRWWYLPPALLCFGALATISRTSVVMLAAAVAVATILRPREIRRLLPLVPIVIVVAKFAVPGALGTLQAYFTPEEGLIESQSGVHVNPIRGGAAWCNTAGRVADIGPALDEASHKPLLGYGYGTRITVAATGPADPTEEANACVLDDQWLGTLLDTGLLGVGAWLWLFLRYARRVGREARSDQTDRGLLLAALASSVVAYTVGMFFFDAFAFLQVTLLVFVLIAFGAVAMRPERAPRERERAATRVPAPAS